jgi:hypothetical protein
VDDSAVPRTRANPNFRKRLENKDVTPTARESASNRAAHDATADDDYVGLFHGL